MFRSGGIDVLFLGFDNRWSEWSVSFHGHLTPGKTSALLVEVKAKRAPEPFWTPCTRGKSFASSRD